MLHRRGVTLIEVLIVLVIVSVLAALGFGMLRTAKSKAYVAAMRSDLHTLRTAQEAFLVENHQYSTDTSKLTFHSSAGVVITLSTGNAASGYTAVATHQALPGQKCGMYVGTDAVSAPGGVTMCTQAPTGGLAGAAAASKRTSP